MQQLKDLTLEWVQGSNTGNPGGGQGGGSAATRPVATKLWQVPEYKARYRAIYRSLVENQMVPATLVSRMNALRSMIAPFVQKDSQKLVTQSQFDNAMTANATSPAGGGPAGGPGGAPALQPFIEGRVASVKAQLDGQCAVDPVGGAAFGVLCASHRFGDSSVSDSQPRPIRRREERQLFRGTIPVPGSR